MVRLSGTTIIMTAGDTFATTITIKNPDGTIYTPQEGDVVTFGMKRTIDDTSCLVTKIIPHETMILKLDSADTNALTPGNYTYDVEITFNNGDVSTLINCARIKLVGQVVNHV